MSATSSTKAEPDGPRPGERGLVLLLGALTMFGPVTIDMYLPALPAIGAALDASPAQTQSSVGAFLVGMAIGQFAYGAAADRLGRRPPILFGLALYVAASAACALATTYEVLVAARLFQALGACAGVVIARAIVRDRFDHTETARVLSLMMLISGLAPILAPLLGGFVLLLAGWRTIFWIMTVFGAAMGLFVLLRLAETRSQETADQARSENPVRAYLELLRYPRLVGYALAGALNGAMLFTYIAISPEMLIGYYRIPAAQFGWVFSVNAVGLIIGGQLNRRLLRTRTPDQVLKVSSLVTVGVAVGLALCIFTGLGGRAGVLAMLFLLLSSYGLLQGNTMAGGLSVDPQRAGSTSALIGGLSFAAGAVASLVTGFLHDGTPRPLAMTVLLAAAGSAAALRFLALPRRRVAPTVAPPR